MRESIAPARAYGGLDVSGGLTREVFGRRERDRNRLEPDLRILAAGQVGLDFRVGWVLPDAGGGPLDVVQLARRELARA